jgi:hypothetical protein
VALDAPSLLSCAQQYALVETQRMHRCVHLTAVVTAERHTHPAMPVQLMQYSCDVTMVYPPDRPVTPRSPLRASPAWASGLPGTMAVEGKVGYWALVTGACLALVKQGSRLANQQVVVMSNAALR